MNSIFPDHDFQVELLVILIYQILNSFVLVGLLSGLNSSISNGCSNWSNSNLTNKNCVPLVRLALDLDTEPKFESLTYVLRPTDKQADRHEDLCL